MLSRLRLRLTLLYLLAALTLIILVGVGLYALLVGYFERATDRALDYKMAYEFRKLGAPMPDSLLAAEQAVFAGNNAPALGLSDGSELAAIFVLPLNRQGEVSFNPNSFAPPIAPDQTAFTMAMAQGADRRTVRLADESRVRLLTYRVTRADGPVALQVGRPLAEQAALLQQVALGLVALGGLSAVVLGWSSWWIAGRSIRPTQQAWERQQTFIANASHELRAPLTLIRASAEVVLRSLPADEQQRELLGDVLQEADHMTRMVEDLLLLSRLDSKRVQFELQPVDVAPLLAEVQRQLGRLAEANGLQLVVEQSASMVCADPTRLRQVLLIVLDNAMRYTPRGGTIRLVARAEARAMSFMVSNPGPGIPPEHLPHVFERFYRVESSRTSERTGSGLGLSIAQALVEAQGGRISVQSQPNVQTDVIINLPRANSLHQPPPPPPLARLR